MRAVESTSTVANVLIHPIIGVCTVKQYYLISPLGNLMITHTHPIEDNLPINTIVAKNTHR